MESFLVQAGYAAIFLFGFLEACCVPIPSEITFGYAGVLAGEGHLNIAGVIIVGTVAELAGSMVSYSAGRAGGRPLVHKCGRYLLITHADIDRAERFLAGRGIWAVPVARALPVVRSFASVVAGFVEIPPALFAVLSAIGTAVWVSAIALLGYGLSGTWTSIANGIKFAGYVIAVVAVLAIAAFVFYRLREMRKEGAAGQRAWAEREAQAEASHRARHARAHGPAPAAESAAGPESQPSPKSPMP
jgi:membrane protein DedA with SNARE-associated domain